VLLATETIPVPAEHCPLVCHLDESTVQHVENPAQRVPAGRELAADRRRPTNTRPPSRRAAAAAGSSVTMAAVTWRRQQPMTSHHASVTSRKSLQRMNRVSEHMSHCPRQRRYNYKLCYSDRQRRAF